MNTGFQKIFYQGSGYPIQRNVVDLPFENHTPQKKIGFLKILTHLHYKLRGINPLLSNTHWESFKKSDGLWHFFNTISFGKTPWVVTYETALPRWFTENNSLLEYGVKALASNRCKKLIAISECSKNFQKLYLEKEFPSYTSQITPKVTVIHPPQELLVNSLDEKKVASDKLIFTMVGSDFFRKGGKEILRVFDSLLSDKASVELNIISTLDYGDYATKTTIDDLTEAQDLINKHSGSIHYFEKLPNKKVLKKLKNSHVGLLPTYADTYGYSVLEAQACGCPVITTNIRALPEINNNKCGWIIEVPKNRWGNGILNTPEERSQFSDILHARLYEVITNLISNPDQIVKKGRRSLDKIRQNHSPKIAARRLEQIYEKALS